MLKEGSPAPDFALPDDDGNVVRLGDLAGKKIVIYFYPKDDTPGCTKEACSFRDHHDAILAKNAVVLGISADDKKSHQNFKTKYALPFRLLSDPDHTTIKAYDAWGEKNKDGKTYEGILRSTVVIDEEGRISKVFQKVKPADHGPEVLGSL